MPLPRLQPIRGLAAIGLAAPCGCQPAAPIKVAFIGGLSGHVSELAIDGRNGVHLAIETLNAQAGPRYELHVHDDGRAKEEASATIDTVADEGDAFAVEPMTSVVATRMVPEATKRQLVLISPTANSDELSVADDGFFRMIPPVGPGADQLADAAISRGLRAPREWPGLQLPVMLDHFADSIHRFHLSEVRKGRLVMLAS